MPGKTGTCFFFVMGAQVGGGRSAFVVAVFGLAMLALGRLSPGDEDMVGVLLPPWQMDALARVAAMGLPIVDMRAGGLLAVVAGDAAARSRLSDAGFLLVATRAAGLCALEGENRT